MANYRPGIVFIGMETSGKLRRRFQALGYETYSCDLLPSDDGGEEMAWSDDGIPLGRHVVGEVFSCLENMMANDMRPSAAFFHPTCTYLTIAAEWAYKDPDFERYPGVGYHQRLAAGTLFGSDRRRARSSALTGGGHAKRRLTMCAALQRCRSELRAGKTQSAFLGRGS